MNIDDKKNTTPAQSRKFAETARELGCDEDEAAFDEKLRDIVDYPVRKNVHNDEGEDGDQKATVPAVKRK